MHIAVLSDVHSNLPALEAVLADIERERIREIIVAGDLIGGSAQPCEVVRRLRDLGCRMIRGNGEERTILTAAGEVPPEWQTCQQMAPVRFGIRQLDRETLDFIAALPEQIVVALDGTDPIRVVHGSPPSLWKGIQPDRNPAEVDQALAEIEEKVLVCGHTHRAWTERRGDRLVVNPGAVCGPLDGQIGAEYAILRWESDRWEAEHRVIPYDLSQVRAAFVASGLLDDGGPVARAILLSIERGRDVVVGFLHHAYRLAEARGFGDCDCVPDAILDEAAATFGWGE